MNIHDSMIPVMYLHDKNGDIRGIPNFERMCLFPIPMDDLDFVIYKEQRKNGSIGHWFYIGEKPLMTEKQMMKAKQHKSEY